MTFLISVLREYVQDKSKMPDDQFSAERIEGTRYMLKPSCVSPDFSDLLGQCRKAVLETFLLATRRHCCVTIAKSYRGFP